MSPYEVLVFVALAGAAVFGWRLYRKDTRGKGLDAAERPANQGELMFGRRSRSKPGEGQ